MAKPVLLLVLPQLVDQWCEEIVKIAPGVIDLHKYSGNYRSSRVSGGPDHYISDILSPEHPVSTPGDPTKVKLIISTPPTINKRHPATTKKKSGQEVPSDLTGLLEILIIDEAHQIKDVSSQIYYTIILLDADFHLLTTATPILNGIEDFKAYLPLLQSRQAEA